MPAPIKGKGRKIYKTMQGKQVDLDLLIKRNELTPAVGNARVNARGDELGPGGRIIRKREEVVKDYYNKSSKPVVTEKVSASKPVADNVSAAEKEMFEEFDEQTPPVKKTTSKAKEEWVEDDEGNFVKK
jgi:hypothetical protein